MKIGLAAKSGSLSSDLDVYLGCSRVEIGGAQKFVIEWATKIHVEDLPNWRKFLEHHCSLRSLDPWAPIECNSTQGYLLYMSRWIKIHTFPIKTVGS